MYRHTRRELVAGSALATFATASVMPTVSEAKPIPASASGSIGTLAPSTVTQAMTDNAGSTDEHRALNYRYTNRKTDFTEKF